MPSLSATAPPGSLRELAEPAQAEPLELRVALRRQREQRERERLEKRLLLRLRDEQDLAWPGDARRGEGGEAAAGSADAWIPRRAGGCERPLERRLHAPVQPLDPAGLEDDGAVLGGIDSEAGILEAAQHTLPLPLHGGRVAVDENERRTCRERLPQPHPRLHARSLGGGGHGPEERLFARRRCERGGLEREPRPQRGAPLSARTRE